MKLTRIREPSPDLTSVDMYVTPDHAAEWIRYNFGNCPVGWEKVETFANKMKDGTWKHTEHPVKFNERGTGLENGQHRLLAIIRAGVPAHIRVVNRPDMVRDSDVEGIRERDS